MELNRGGFAINGATQSSLKVDTELDSLATLVTYPTHAKSTSLPKKIWINLKISMILVDDYQYKSVSLDFFYGVQGFKLNT